MLFAKSLLFNHFKPVVSGDAVSQMHDEFAALESKVLVDRPAIVASWCPSDLRPAKHLG